MICASSDRVPAVPRLLTLSPTVLQISHGWLARVPLLYPALRQAFSESYDQCVERTAKRRDRKQREAEVLADACR